MMLLWLDYADTIVFEVLAFDAATSMMKLRHLVTFEVTEVAKDKVRSRGYKPIDKEVWSARPGGPTRPYEQNVLDKYLAKYG